jgi:REP element-mobilizing transposase RayT
MSGDRYYINDQNAIYFVTFTIVGWLDVFVRSKYKRVIVDSLDYCSSRKGLSVHAWCLMTSHLHLIVSADEGYKLSEIIRDFKKHTAKQILKSIDESDESRRNWLLWYFEKEGKKDVRISKYKFWQESNHAVLLERANSKMIEQKLNYIHQNPVVEGIVENAQDYLYSSARDYYGMVGLVKIKGFLD